MEVGRRPRRDGFCRREAARSTAAVGIVNLLAAFFATFERFHMLLAIACFVSAGSLVLGFWRRSPTQAHDGAPAPVALLLFVWAIGLYGYAIGSAAGDTLNRFAAGVVGTAYVLDFAVGVLRQPRLFAGRRSLGGT